MHQNAQEKTREVLQFPLRCVPSSKRATARLKVVWETLSTEVKNPFLSHIQKSHLCISCLQRLVL